MLRRIKIEHISRGHGGVTLAIIAVGRLKQEEATDVLADLMLHSELKVNLGYRMFHEDRQFHRIQTHSLWNIWIGDIKK